MTTLSQIYLNPRKHERNDKNVITFIRIYKPNHQIFSNKFKNYINNTTNREIQKAFDDKNFIFNTRPEKLRNMLVGAKCESKTIPKSPKLTGLFLYNNCVYDKMSLLNYVPYVPTSLACLCAYLPSCLHAYVP